MQNYNRELFRLICFLALLSPGALVRAQYNLPENSFWTFGKYGGIDFTTGTPQPFQSASWGGGYALWEATATVSDTAGRLLFYTTGSVIWNRMHMPMPNASPLHGGAMPSNTSIKITESTSQGALIVPFPDSTEKYFVFSLTNGELRQPPGSNKLFYSVVDMSLAGGMGDVVTGRKWIELDTGLSEKMVAIPGACNNIWVLVQMRDTNMFKAYQVTSGGLNTTPVISYAGRFVKQLSPLFPGNYAWRVGGGLTVSHDWKKLVRSDYFGGILELLDFDNTTGIVAPQSWIIDSSIRNVSSFYSACFSPDNSRLYACTSSDTAYAPFPYYIHQYDMSSGQPATIRASKTFVGFGCNQFVAGMTLALGPDGKIYFQDTFSSNNVIGVIESPNLPVPACGFRSNALQMIPGTSMSLGLHTPFVKPVPLYTYFRHPDTFVCSNSTLLLCPASGGKRHSWNDGTTDSTLVISRPGLYWVRFQTPCGWQSDTFHVHETNINLHLGGDTMICGGGPYRLTAPFPDADYFWQNGSNAPYFDITKSGKYWLQVSRKGCVASDTVQVRIVDAPDLDIGRDTTICAHAAFRIGAEIPGASYTWNTGDTTPYIKPALTGLYRLQVDYQGCLLSDSVRVTILPVPDAFIGADGVLCPGAHRLLQVPARPGYSYRWSTGAEDPEIRVDDPGLYSVEVRNPEGCTAADTIRLDRLDPPTVFLGGDTAVCLERPFRIAAQSSFADRLLWQDGSTDNDLLIHQPGVYYVTVGNACGSSSDTISVTALSCHIWLPDAFTPNGDGRNDLFRCLGNLTGADYIRLAVFDRWGKQVFYTGDKQEGWDGHYNGASCPAGTYMYMLHYSVNGREYMKKGDVMLVR